MGDKLLELSQPLDNDPKNVRLKAISGDPDSAYAIAVDGSSSESTAPTLYNITLTLADTEYAQALPAGTRSISFQARTAAAVRYAYATGKVAASTAPYMTLPANAGYTHEHFILASATIYFASSSAGTVVEMEVWV